MSTKTPTIRLTVTEVVTYEGDVPLTDGLLDEAASEGYERTAKGVAEYLAHNPDHEEVLAVVEHEDKYGCKDNFMDVLDRTADWDGEVN